MNKIQNYDLIKADLHALGTTLLCALYLCNPIDIEKYERLNNDFASGSKNYKSVKKTKSTKDNQSIFTN